MTARVARMVALLGCAGAVSAPAAAAGPSAQRLSQHPLALSHRWAAYDEAPSTALLRPVRILQVSGHVSDPQALATPSTADRTTLTYPTGGPAPSLVLDYGREVAGVASFEVTAATAKTVSVSYSEVLSLLGDDGAASVAAFHSGNGNRTDTLAVGHPGIVTAPLIQGGERYERITLSSPGSLSLRSAGIRFTALRATPPLMAGHFLSSDSLLNRIWYAGAYTLNLNQMTPGTSVQPGVQSRGHLILDGAKRDRAVWSGDHLISDLTDYYVSDPVYARDSLALLLDHPASSAGNLVQASGRMSQPGPLPGVCSPNPAFDVCDTWSANYSMVVIPALYNYYLYTGDLAFVRRHWQAVARQMAWDAQQVGADGLFAVTDSESADWNIERIGGETTYNNAVYVLALRAAARLASALGHGSQAEAWSAAAARLRQAVNRRLWDAREGVYDAVRGERGPVVQDANVTAILAGIPRRARARSIVEALQRDLGSPFGPLSVSSPAPPAYNQDVSPYMGSFQVLADFATGDQAAALANVRREWGYMVSHDPGGVDWERIHLNGKLLGGPLADSAAHAWSTGPTAAMSEYLLGVTPATPGYRRWLVAPQPGALAWAQGVVSTPRGRIAVLWQRGRSRGWFRLTVMAPARTLGTVLVPLLGRRRVIAMDGRIVWDGRRAIDGAHAHRTGAAVAFSGIRSAHTFAWSA